MSLKLLSIMQTKQTTKPKSQSKDARVNSAKFNALMKRKAELVKNTQKRQAYLRGMHMLLEERLKKQNLFWNQLNAAERQQKMNFLMQEMLLLT